MKILALIISLYILMLTTIPCIDAPEDISGNLNETSQSSSGDQNHENHHCSPFCTCQCCATPVLFGETQIQFTSFTYSHKPLSEYSTTYVSTLFSSIWQPPKLV